MLRGPCQDFCLHLAVLEAYLIFITVIITINIILLLLLYCYQDTAELGNGSA